jgi:hypothetical protein
MLKGEELDELERLTAIDEDKLTVEEVQRRNELLDLNKQPGARTEKFVSKSSDNPFD